MDSSCRPGNGLIGRKIGAERFPKSLPRAPESDADLNRNIGSSACGTRRLKVDCGELLGPNGVGSGDGERHPDLRGLNMGWFYNGDSGVVR